MEAEGKYPGGQNTRQDKLTQEGAHRSAGIPTSTLQAGDNRHLIMRESKHIKETEWHLMIEENITRSGRYFI